MRGFVPPLFHMHPWPPICRRFIRSVTVKTHSHSDRTLHMIIKTIQALVLTLPHSQTNRLPGPCTGRTGLIVPFSPKFLT
jgi:hypothetical protein